MHIFHELCNYTNTVVEVKIQQSIGVGISLLILRGQSQRLLDLGDIQVVQHVHM